MFVSGGQKGSVSKRRADCFPERRGEGWMDRETESRSVSALIRVFDFKGN